MEGLVFKFFIYPSIPSIGWEGMPTMMVSQIWTTTSIWMEGFGVSFPKGPYPRKPKSDQLEAEGHGARTHGCPCQKYTPPRAICPIPLQLCRGVSHCPFQENEAHLSRKGSGMEIPMVWVELGLIQTQ